MGNIEGSHKKRKPTRASFQTPSPLASIRRNLNEVSNAGSIITPSSTAAASSPPSPVTIPSSQLIDPAGGGSDRLSKRHKTTHLVKTAPKLTTTTIMPWLRKGIVGINKPTSAETVMKRVRNSFIIKRTVANKPSATSSASSAVRSSARVISQSQTKDRCEDRVSPSTRFLALTSFSLRRLVVEDVFSLSVGSDVLLLVSADHPSYSTTYYPMYLSSKASTSYLQRPLVTLGDTSFIQLQATILKNNRKSEMENGIMPRPDLDYLLTEVGAGSIGLHFPDCNRSLEMKWSEIFHNLTTFQLWE